MLVLRIFRRLGFELSSVRDIDDSAIKYSRKRVYVTRFYACLVILITSTYVVTFVWQQINNWKRFTIHEIALHSFDINFCLMFAILAYFTVSQMSTGNAR